MNIGSFFAQLGFEIDASQLQPFEEQVAAAREVALGFGAAFVAAGTALVGFTAHVLDGIDELGDFADINQISIETIQELGYAAQLSGSSIEAMKSSAAGLNRTLGEAALGVGRSAKLFEKLHFSAKNADGTVKSFDQLLLEVSDRMQTLSRQEQIALASKLGIDPTLVPLLAKGRDAISDLQEEARAFGVTTQEQAAAAGDFMDSLDRIRFVVSVLSRSIAVQLAPALTAIVNGTREWFIANREILRSGITSFVRAFLAVLQFVVDWVQRLAGWLSPLVDWLTKTGIAATAAAAGLALLTSWLTGHVVLGFAQQVATLVRWVRALNVAALTIPLVIGAIVVALALLVDDFINFREGNESVIGDLVKKFPMLLDVINAIEAGVRAAFGFWMDNWSKISGSVGELGTALWELAKAVWPIAAILLRALGWAFEKLLPVVIWTLKAVIKTLTVFIDGAVTVLSWLIDGVTWIVNAITQLFSGSVSDWVSAFSLVAGAITAIWQGVFDWIAGKLRATLGLVADGVAAVAKFLNLGGGASVQVTRAVQQAPGMQRLPLLPSANDPTNTSGALPALGQAAVPLLAQANGPLGVAAGGGGVMRSTTVNIPGGITVVSSDPATAGKSVTDALGAAGRQAVRNGQSEIDI